MPINGGNKVEFSTILIIIGIICIVASFFLKDTSKKVEQDLEDLSISIYQETNSLKKRLKIIEEELLLEPNFAVKQSTIDKKSFEIHNKNAQLTHSSQTNAANNTQQINEILVNQVIQLNKQGYPVDEISKMSTLSKEQILTILKNGGAR
ncbi:hypothetical protein CD33_16045 [Ureibacillus sinduriensis BLB-1 = JCM 15800]|uniref:Resolvase HTH domain-containing protein n=1 Tax=Ureibacillus sinduriensis BLB-1 = JCM 15800 TaxID=1384057 RepID=A0A0A3IIC1_9BACL|nr:hypothetical protein CD33_16045 [Ureibacillus sinduriensis BLB-1 = JCM 15800]